MPKDYSVGGRTGAGEYNPQLDKIQRNKRIASLKTQEANPEDEQHLFRNQYGLLECKLCCTHHRTEASYIAHTYGKTHRRNVERRRIFQARTEAMAGVIRAAPQPKIETPIPKQSIGDPTYDVYKPTDPDTGNLTIL